LPLCSAPRFAGSWPVPATADGAPARLSVLGRVPRDPLPAALVLLPPVRLPGSSSLRGCWRLIHPFTWLLLPRVSGSSFWCPGGLAVAPGYALGASPAPFGFAVAGYLGHWSLGLFSSLSWCCAAVVACVFCVLVLPYRLALAPRLRWSVEFSRVFACTSCCFASPLWGCPLCWSSLVLSLSSPRPALPVLAAADFFHWLS